MVMSNMQWGRQQLPKDEVRDIDPELEKLWFEARERQLGFLSPYSFDVPGGAAASSEAIESLNHWHQIDQHKTRGLLRGFVSQI